MSKADVLAVAVALVLPLLLDLASRWLDRVTQREIALRLERNAVAPEWAEAERFVAYEPGRWRDER